MLLLLLVLETMSADVVLLRYAHGNRDDRHTDEISCVVETHSSEQLFSAEKLLEKVVLPDALWCDGDGKSCHDSTSGREYRAASLECNESPGAPVRCRVLIDCSELILSFWHSLVATMVSVVLFIFVPHLCCTTRHRRAVDYDRDTSL
jgi:hypothetical protein